MKAGWQSLKRELRERGSLDEFFVLDEVVTAPDIDPRKFDPLLLQRNVEGAARLLDRCLAIRKEVRDLEILAVKAAADYQLFLDTSEKDEEMERLRLMTEAKVSEGEGYGRSATQFGEVDGVGRGWRELSLGKAQALGQEVTDLRRVDALLIERWRQVREYQNAYHLRSLEPGNAHNYAERSRNLVRLYLVLSTELMERLHAVRRGLLAVYRWTEAELPVLSDLMALDDVAIWLVQAQQRLDLLREKEETFDLVLPLVQPWMRAGAGLVSAEEFQQKLGETPAVLTFELRPELFSGQDVRLAGFGLAFGNRFNLIRASGVDAGQTADSFTRLAVTVTPPEQDLGDGTTLRRSPFVLGNVGLHQADQPAAFTTGVGVENIDPRGTWSLTIHPYVVWKEDKVTTLAEGILGERIRDLKLLLRLQTRG